MQGKTGVYPDLAIATAYLQSKSRTDTVAGYIGSFTAYLRLFQQYGTRFVATTRPPVFHIETGCCDHQTTKSSSSHFRLETIPTIQPCFVLENESCSIQKFAFAILFKFVIQYQIGTYSLLDNLPSTLTFEMNTRLINSILDFCLLNSAYCLVRILKFQGVIERI